MSKAVDRPAMIRLFEEIRDAFPHDREPQGATLEETRANLREAVALVEANRMFAREDGAEGDEIREPIKVTA